jgi:hypothetical protein
MPQHVPRGARCRSGVSGLVDDEVGQLVAVLCAGQTAYLPSGWLRAQLAVTDGSAAAGRWLQRGALAPQIAAWKLAVGSKPCLLWGFCGGADGLSACVPCGERLSSSSAATYSCPTLHGRPDRMLHGLIHVTLIWRRRMPRRSSWRRSAASCGALLWLPLSVCRERRTSRRTASRPRCCCCCWSCSEAGCRCRMVSSLQRCK